MTILYSRVLRNNLTEAEKVLWRALRYRQIAGYKFRRQVSIGRYIVDFVCYEKRIVIEVDGSQHFDNRYDLERTAWLNGQGFQVYRFWNNEVLGNLEKVKEAIYHACMNLTSPHPAFGHLPPQGGKVN